MVKELTAIKKINVIKKLTDIQKFYESGLPIFNKLQLFDKRIILN